MNLRQLLELVMLAALWGASFLFMRIGAPEMGPVGLIAIRTLVAGLFLLPFLFFYNSHRGVRRHVPTIAFVGVIGSAMPFALIAYATLTVTAGYASILNATTPMFGALVAWMWLGDRLSPSGIIGLLVGFAGVFVLVWGRGEMPSLQLGTAVAAALTATLLYALAATTTKRYLAEVHPLTLATLSQLFAAASLLPLALLAVPEQMPSAKAWWSVLLLGIASTGIAYVIYFRLISQVGPTKTLTVTFLIPAFGLFWGWLFLEEEIGWSMVAGCLLILLGVGLTTGVLAGRSRRLKQG
ncbi:MAG: DMT family transporter [Chromatiales bacterium]|jgi:drug/metabolite transporter (DMT)-like permease